MLSWLTVTLFMQHLCTVVTLVWSTTVTGWNEKRAHVNCNIKIDVKANEPNSEKSGLFHSVVIKFPS